MLGSMLFIYVEPNESYSSSNPQFLWVINSFGRIHSRFCERSNHGARRFFSFHFFRMQEERSTFTAKAKS